MCEHKEVVTYKPFLKCASCGTKLCSNCVQPWAEGHSCPNNLKINTTDTAKVKALWGGKE